jgi:nucleoid-associated protein YgaU
MAGAAIGTPVTSSAPYIAPAPRPPVSTADPGPSTVLTGVAHRSSDDTGYVVRRGDALWDIAARHLGPTASAAEIARAWPRWYSANRAVIGADPGMIRPGQILFAPTRGHA